MASCKGCGLEIGENVLFCPYCGQKKVREEIRSDVPGPLRIVPARVLIDETWTMAALRLSSDSISIFVMPVTKKSVTTIGLFRPAEGYLPSIKEIAALEKTDAPSDFDILVDEISKVDLSYVQVQDEELYALHINHSRGLLDVRIPMDRTYRDALISLLGSRLKW